MTEQQDFGAFLRRAREHREIPLAEVARRTKVSIGCLEKLEQGSLGELPPEVFVRGFIRSYARSIGIADGEALDRFERAVSARRQEEEVVASTVPQVAIEATLSSGEDDDSPHRRGIGLAVFVIIVLLIATITLSLYLRQPPQSGEGLSEAGDARPPTPLFLG